MRESPRTRRTRQRKLDPRATSLDKQEPPKIKPGRSISSCHELDAPKASAVGRSQQDPEISSHTTIESTIEVADSSTSPSMASATQTMPAQTSHHRFAPAASDNGSSSLSDLDEVADMQQELDAKVATDDEGSKDDDTEAETERIDPSPRKSRKLVTEAAESAMGRDEIEGIVSDRSNPTLISNEIAQANGHIMLVDTHVQGPDGKGSESPRKRKRSSPLSELDEKEFQEGQPARKRSASAKLLGLTRSEANVASDNGSAIAEEDDTAMKDASDLSGEADNTHHATELDTVAVDPASIIEPPERAQGRDINSTRSSIEADEVQYSPEGIEEEVLPQPDAEADENEAAARTEEELAKKLLALEDLKPIEVKFAMFRDKLFDEKLQELSKIQEDLAKDEPTNATFLKQKQCVDARRDEKIRLENVLFHYKAEEMERVALANRAITHSQFGQNIRHARDECMQALNNSFSNIQKERRQLQTDEPQLYYPFVRERQEQIANQRMYNKEVSLLAGIARHSGFPAAPELGAAGSSDVEADLKRMKIQRNVQPYAAQLANSSHQQEMAGEAHFLERNQWARNPITVPRAHVRDGQMTSPFPVSRHRTREEIQMLEDALTLPGMTPVSGQRPLSQSVRRSPLNADSRRTPHNRRSPREESSSRRTANLQVDMPDASTRRRSPLRRPDSQSRRAFGTSPMPATTSELLPRSPQPPGARARLGGRNQRNQRADREDQLTGFRNSRPVSTADHLLRPGRFSLPPTQQQDRPLFGPIQSGITTEPTGPR